MFTFINPFVSISLLYIILNIRMEIVNKLLEIIINFSSPLSTLYYFFQVTRIIEIKKLIKNEDDLKCNSKLQREIS